MGGGRDSPLSTPSPYRILFVCTGNTCRSPMAEVVARDGLRRRGWRTVEVASAGTSAVEGMPASPGARGAARMSGLDLSMHRSRLLDAAAVEAADLILVMTESHRSRVAALGGAERSALLGGMAPGDGDRPADAFDLEIPDPYGGSGSEYEATLRVLTARIETLLDRLAPVLDP